MYMRCSNIIRDDIDGAIFWICSILVDCRTFKRNGQRSFVNIILTFDIYNWVSSYEFHF